MYEFLLPMEIPEIIVIGHKGHEVSCGLSFVLPNEMKTTKYMQPRRGGHLYDIHSYEKLMPPKQ